MWVASGFPTVEFTYGYDAVNNRTSVADAIDGTNAGLETFEYDQLNRVTRIAQSGTNVAEKSVRFEYDAASQMRALTRFSDLAQTQEVASSNYSYDQAGRLEQLIHRNADLNDC